MQKVDLALLQRELGIRIGGSGDLKHDPDLPERNTMYYGGEIEKSQLGEGQVRYTMRHIVNMLAEKIKNKNYSRFYLRNMKITDDGSHKVVLSGLVDLGV